jgi:hypothetical protein
MDLLTRLFAAVAAFTALAEGPSGWSRYTTESAINSIGGKFALRHNRAAMDSGAVPSVGPASLC